MFFSFIYPIKSSLNIFFFQFYFFFFPVLHHPVISYCDLSLDIYWVVHLGQLISPVHPGILWKMMHQSSTRFFLQLSRARFNSAIVPRAASATTSFGRRSALINGYTRFASSTSATQSSETASQSPESPEILKTDSQNEEQQTSNQRRAHKSNRSSFYTGPILSKKQKNEIDSQYNEIKTFLDQGDIASASTKFLEVYKPEETFLFKNFNREKSQGPDRLHIQLFNKVLQANKKSQNTEGLISVSDLYSKYLEGGINIGWMCSESILFEVSNKRPSEGLELWVKFMEANGDISNVQSSENREAAVSAIIAYISNCISEGTEPTSNIALALVPLKRLPDNTDITRIVRTSNIKFSNGFLKEILEGFGKVRYESLDPGDIDFLNSLPVDQPLELENRYADCIRKATESDTPLPESTYARFIFCFAESKRFDRSFAIWQDLIDSGITPSVQTWNMLLKAAALTPGDKVALLEALISKMEDSNIKPNSDSYGILIDTYFKSRQSETAIEIFQKIDSREIDVPINLYIFNVVLNGLLNSGRDVDARELLNAGIEKGLSPDIISFNTFITTYIKKKKYKEVEVILDLMSQTGVYPNVVTYTNLIDSIYKVANEKNLDPKEQVEKLIKSMNDQGIRTNVPTMTAIIDGIAKSGNGHESNMQLYRLMQKKQLRPNNRTFTALINGEIISGNIEQAIFFFNEMKQYNIIQKTSSFNQLLRAFATRGLIEYCTSFFRDLVSYKHASPNVYTYTFALQCCINSKNMTFAQEVLDNLATQPKDFYLGSTLSGVLRDLKKSGLNVPTFEHEKQTPYAKKLAEQEEL